ncbi:long-chain-acyl-CoA synthetase [compost metagenome]
MLNVDNRVGSCGRVPFWDKTNLRLLKYDTGNQAHLRDAEGRYIHCQPGEVGEAVGMIFNHPEIGAGRFEGYTSAEATEKKTAMPGGVQGICCAMTRMATAISSTASATPSAGRARTYRPWKWPMRWATSPAWN